MSRSHVERLEQPDGVVGHVVYRVRPPRPACQDGERRGRSQLRKVAGQPRIAVVEANDEIALIGERLAQLVRPGDHLRSEAHDEKERRIRGIAECLKGNLNPICRHRGRLAEHGRQPTGDIEDEMADGPEKVSTDLGAPPRRRSPQPATSNARPPRTA